MPSHLRVSALLTFLALPLACKGSIDDGGSSGGNPDFRFYDDACIVDADCGAGLSCQLGTCITLCSEDDPCPSGQTCSLHGVCVGEDMPLDEQSIAVLPVGQASRISDTVSPVVDGQATTTLTNDSDRPIRFRLESSHPAVTVPLSPQLLDPGASVDIIADVDLAMIEEGRRRVLVDIITGEGSISWLLEAPALAAGHWNLTLSPPQGSPIGEMALGVNLDFAADGSVSGQTFADESLLWPRDATISGTWDPTTGDVDVWIRDVVPAAAEGVAEGPTNPLSRDVGREIHLVGTLNDTRDQVTGTMTERLSGLADTILEIEGVFGARRDAGLREPSPTVTDFSGDLPVLVPTWEFPPDLDMDACTGLGGDYGTAATINDNDPASKAQDCAACTAQPMTCTAAEAASCAGALLVSGFNLPIETSSGDNLQPPAIAAWETCTSDGKAVYDATGTTCLDQQAVRCAGALMRHALLESGGTAEYLTGALDQVAAEAGMGAAVGTERLIQALFAYKDTSGAKIWLVEKDFIERAQAQFTRPLQVMFSPGFSHVLQGLGKDVVLNQRLGADVSRMLDLASRSMETLISDMRLQQRAMPEDPELGRKKVAYAAVWTHLQGAMLDDLTDRFEIPDTYAAVQTTTESIANLEALSKGIGTDKNPFGFSPEFVPIKLATVGDNGERLSNYEVIRSDSNLSIDFYKAKIASAEQVLETLAQAEYNIVNQTNNIETDFNDRLARLCGEQAMGGPDTANCGQNTGEVREAAIRIELAAKRIEAAQIALANNQERIAIEEDRIREVVANASDLEMQVSMLQQDIFQVEDMASMQVSALELAKFNNEKSKVWQDAAFESATIGVEAIADAANAFGDTPPDIGGGVTAIAAGAAKIALTFGKAGNDVAFMQKQYDLDNMIGDIQSAAQRDITIINSQIDQAIRQSSVNEKVINSKAIVKGLMLDTAQRANEVDQAILEANLASAQLATALTEVSTLVASRDRALAILATDPQNPFTNARFLRLRMEVGRSLLRWRELALKAAYRAGRALEFELNRDVTFIETDLYPARSPEEVDEYLFCLDSAFSQYQDNFSDIGSQALQLDISLRDAIFGLGDTLTDQVTGKEVQPSVQFANFLVSPDNVNGQGAIELNFALPLLGDTLFPQAQCDARIESIEVQLVGDNMGDGAAGVILLRDGTSDLRRCDSANLAPEDSLVTYNLDPEAIAIQATVNTWSEDDTGKSFGYAGWPVSGSQWILQIPTAEQDPSNADFDVRNIQDIRVRVNYRAGTVSPTGDGFTPTCG